MRKVIQIAVLILIVMVCLILGLISRSQLVMGLVVFFTAVCSFFTSGYVLGYGIVGKGPRPRVIDFRDPLWIWLLNPLFFIGPVVAAIFLGLFIWGVPLGLIDELTKLLKLEPSIFKGTLEQIELAWPLFFALMGVLAYIGLALGLYRRKQKILNNPEELCEAIREALRVMDRLLNRISALKGYKRRRFDRRLTARLGRHLTRKTIPKEYWVTSYLPPEDFAHAFRTDIYPRLEVMLDNNDLDRLRHSYDTVMALIGALEYLSKY